jgi:hypothetical protein
MVRKLHPQSIEAVTRAQNISTLAPQSPMSAYNMSEGSAAEQQTSSTRNI